MVKMNVIRSGRLVVTLEHLTILTKVNLKWLSEAYGTSLESFLSSLCSCGPGCLKIICNLCCHFLRASIVDCSRLMTSALSDSAICILPSSSPLWNCGLSCSWYLSQQPCVLQSTCSRLLFWRADCQCISIMGTKLNLTVAVQIQYVES
jgi:hypothetical protein